MTAEELVVAIRAVIDGIVTAFARSAEALAAVGRTVAEAEARAEVAGGPACWRDRTSPTDG